MCEDLGGGWCGHCGLSKGEARPGRPQQSVNDA